MIQKELLLAVILTSNILGSYTNPQYAISSQSYHRNDVPLSYEFTVVHDIRSRKADMSNGYQYVKNNKYRPIQYAPLNSRQYREQTSQSLRQKYEQAVTQSVRQTTGSQTPDTTAENVNVYLEPRPFAESGNKIKYQPQILRYPTGAVTQPKKQLLESPIFKPEDIGNSLVPMSKYNYQAKSTQQFSTTSAIKNMPPPLVSQNQYAFGYLPLPEEPRLLHDELVFEKSQSQYHHAPRLHMNVARSYNIATMMQKAPSAPNSKRNNKEPSRIYGYFVPSAEEEKTQFIPLN